MKYHNRKPGQGVTVHGLVKEATEAAYEGRLVDANDLASQIREMSAKYPLSDKLKQEVAAALNIVEQAAIDPDKRTEAWDWLNDLVTWPPVQPLVEQVAA